MVLNEFGREMDINDERPLNALPSMETTLFGTLQSAGIFLGKRISVF
ncbi:MAG: hypothetical protein LKG11_06310 [Bacilli bacterium]|jgi:hypothetical protein|nr:hypothetical protein [Bacilli bacterium]